ncbi:hypothetical protein ARAM_005410 [Aspergillus rambellii]|uniref:Uncharacterized protein n=1 Tax=Aspergillus rambellii TaxID=308745 RepID=A0A0F8UJH9_9EURO|nr:hypothetical protein ARAM_005410 [Aspergillus rambellii]
MSDQSVIKYDWRLKLDNYCWKANIESPTYNTFSDRRGCFQIISSQIGFPVGVELGVELKVQWSRTENACLMLNSENVSADCLVLIIGGRTAWSCTVTVTGRGTYAARYWYDGRFVDNAKEDAAEVALKILDPQGQSGQTSSQEPFQGYIERR